ncbi:MAG: O-antigen ligase family protein [Anaerolineales bacterium]|nr:O-antigen ligase family protein [Anaerolineales bacterium]
MPPLYSDYTNFQLSISDIALIYLLIFWGCSLLINPYKLKAGNGLVWICLVGLTIAGWVSIIGSVDPILSRYHAFRFVLLLLFYLYIVNELQSPVWVIVPIALQIMIQVPIAIGQFFAQSSLGLQRFGEHLLNPQILGISIIPVNELRFLRAYGLSDHPNILGGSIAFSLVILLAIVMYGKHRQPVWASILFLVSFPALMLTFSRSAWLSLSLAGSLMVVCEAVARRWDSVKRVSVLGVLSLIVVLPILFQNFSLFEKRINSGNVSQDAPMQERAYLIEAGNTLFVEHSAIGIGLGATPLAMKERFENFLVSHQPPHYVPLLTSLETGVVGGIFYLILFLMPLMLFITKWRVYITMPFVMGSLALILAVSIVSLFDYYTWYTTGRVWQWLAWGLFSVAIEKASE